MSSHSYSPPQIERNFINISCVRTTLAVGRLDVLPVRQAVLDGEYCRVIVDLIGYSMVIQPGECSLYFF